MIHCYSHLFTPPHLNQKHHNSLTHTTTILQHCIGKNMVVLDEYPGIEVVVRNNGLIVKDNPVPGIDWTRYGSHGSIFPGVSAYVESSEAGAFSVSITVDRKYDFSRDQNHLLCFSTWMESRNPKDKRIITKQHVAAGHGRAHVSCDITLSYRDSWEILGSPIGERGNYSPVNKYPTQLLVFVLFLAPLDAISLLLG